MSHVLSNHGNYLGDNTIIRVKNPPGSTAGTQRTFCVAWSFDRYRWIGIPFTSPNAAVDDHLTQTPKIGDCQP